MAAKSQPEQSPVSTVVVLSSGSTTTDVKFESTAIMVGHANNIDGYAACLQPALTCSVDAGNSEGSNAWALFMNRPIKPNYPNGAQFTIAPRS